MYRGLQAKYTIFFSDVNESYIFSKNFCKNTQISDFMKMHPVGTELFHTDGWVDRRTDGQTW